MAAQTVDINLNSNGYTGNSLQPAFQQQHGSWTSTWLQATAQTMGIPIALGGNSGHGHQPRLWLHQDHGLTHGPQWQYGPRISS